MAPQSPEPSPTQRLLLQPAGRLLERLASALMLALLSFGAGMHFRGKNSKRPDSAN